jgi:PAS domain S-box-containing protein
MPGHLNILLVEDDEDDFVLFKAILSKIVSFTHQLNWAKNYNEAAELIRKDHHDIYFFDYFLGSKTGLELLDVLQKKDEDLPAILLTGKGNNELDRNAIDKGALDYLEKGSINAEALERSIRHAIKHSKTLHALRDSERKYRRVFEGSNEIIFIANNELEIVEISKAVEAYMGYKPEEVYLMKLHEYFENPLQILHLQEAMKVENSIKNYLIHLKAKNGEIKSGLISLVLERDVVGEFFLHGIFTDQTEKLRAERALTQSRKLEATARLMQVLAHEVRNPLMNINLSLESLSDEVREKDAEVLEIIQRNSRRIDKLITEVLQAASEKEMKKEFVLLNDVIEEALFLVNDRAHMQNVSIISKMESTPKIEINAEQITTALVNILINAIEAKVDSSNAEISLKCYHKHGFVVVKIKDNGIGMDEELLAKLFEPFYTAKTNGVGLGLASTLGILKGHQAEIDVKSELGLGAEFIIRFPV